jgi:hypothetical protein
MRHGLLPGSCINALGTGKPAVHEVPHIRYTKDARGWASPKTLIEALLWSRAILIFEMHSVGILVPAFHMINRVWLEGAQVPSIALASYLASLAWVAPDDASEPRSEVCIPAWRLVSLFRVFRNTERESDSRKRKPAANRRFSPGKRERDRRLRSSCRAES